MTAIDLAKVASIQRSVRRARDELAAAGSQLSSDLTRQDASILNVLRACETAIDLAQILVRERRLGVPQSNRDVFQLLADAGLVSEDLSKRLQQMVGFRNVAVHRYRDLDLEILVHVVRQDLDDLLRFSELVARLDR
ncbi:MAG: DUF86 domain-containing protein [Steroidobacteraceae bacterium]